MGQNDYVGIPMSDAKFYKSPFGYLGIGSDIKWCERWRGGKFCMHCGHYAKFEEWSHNWHWYYLLEWNNILYTWWTSREYAHYKVSNFTNTFFKGKGHNYIKHSVSKPKRYKTVGMKETDLKSLLRRGCKKNRKCKCIGVAQRGAWYCPECYYLIMRMAKHRNANFHDLTVMDKNELKEEILILLLSGTI